MSRSKVLLGGSVIAISMGIASFAKAQDNCVINNSPPMHCGGAVKVIERIEVNAPVQYSAAQYSNVAVETNNTGMPQMHSMGGQCNMAHAAMPCGTDLSGDISSAYAASGSYSNNTANSGMVIDNQYSSVSNFSGTGYFYNSGEMVSPQPNVNQIDSYGVSQTYSNGPNYSYGNETAVKYVYGSQMANPHGENYHYVGVGPIPQKVPQVPVNYYGGVAGVPANVPQNPNMPNYSGAPINPMVSGGTYYGQYNGGNYPISSAPGYQNSVYSMPVRGMPIPSGAIPKSFYFGAIASGVGFPTQTGYLGGGSVYYGGGSRFSGVVGRSPTPLIPPGNGKGKAPPPPPPTN